MSEMSQHLFDSGRISEQRAEKVRRQFTMLCTESVKDNEFIAYNQNEMHLDYFYFNILHKDPNKKE